MKKVNNHQKLRQTVLTMLGILFVGALFCLAVAFPRYYSILYDKNTLNKVNYTNIKINTYETSYETFPEKIRSFAQAFMEDGHIHVIRIGEPESWMSKKDLTTIVNRELETMRNNGIMGTILNEQIVLKEKKLSVCERYTIYRTQDEDDLQGTSFWKLVYKKAKKRITLYLDEEFHKIYFLDIKFKQKTDTKTAVKTISTSTIYDVGFDFELATKTFYEWWNGMRHYYGIDSYELQSNSGSVYSWSNIENFHGTIEFDEKYTILLYEQWFADKDKNRHFCMGIPIEEMIQF